MILFSAVLLRQDSSLLELSEQHWRDQDSILSLITFILLGRWLGLTLTEQKLTSFCGWLKEKTSGYQPLLSVLNSSTT